MRRADRHQLAVGLGQARGACDAELLGLALVELLEVLVVPVAARRRSWCALAEPEDDEEAGREDRRRVIVATSLVSRLAIAATSRTRKISVMPERDVVSCRSGC